MKKPLSSRARGFTLVELLVVIAILTVLASAGFAGLNFAMDRARSVSALAVCTAGEKAVNDFFTEYGAMPLVSGPDLTVKTDGTDADGMDLLLILLNREPGDEVENVKGIKFLDTREGKGDKNGLIFGSGGTTFEGLFDPWGGPYFIMLDGDFDEELDVAPTAGGGRTLIGRRVAMWSDGKDFEEGPAGKITNDVTTW